MKIVIIAAATLLLAGPALARGGGEGNNTGCNGQGNPNSPCVPSSGGGGQGGSGGQGGAGGIGVGVGVGVGVGIAQGGRGGSANANAQGGRGGNARGGDAQATGGNATVSVQTDPGYAEARDRVRVPDVNAPAIWSNNPCVVALSGGVAVAGFGASIGAGIEDRDCTRRANAQHLTAMGEREAAREVLCESREVRAAFQRIGRPCVADMPARPDAAGPVQAMVVPVQREPNRQRPAYCDRVPGIANSECR